MFDLLLSKQYGENKRRNYLQQKINQSHIPSFNNSLNDKPY